MNEKVKVRNDTKFSLEDVECTYKHLNAETNLVMEGINPNQKDPDKRFWENKQKLKRYWVSRNHFIFYPKAEKCLEELNLITELSLANKNIDYIEDKDSITLKGDTGLGKTAIINECLRIHQSEHYEDREIFHGAHALLKDEITGMRGMYSALLRPFNHPYAHIDLTNRRDISISVLENTLLHLLEKNEVTIFFIDEFQHIKGRNMQKFLNQIKRTMLVSGVPFVPVGMPEVEDILAFDTQLANRCPVKECSNLKHWKCDKELQQFLRGYETFLPFPEPSRLSRPNITKKIFNKVEFDPTKKGYEHLRANSTNLREITRFLRRVTLESLLKNENCITEEKIVETTFR